MIRCPICGSEAEEIDQGTFDGSGFRCSTHGEVEVTDSALHEEHDSEQWERAFRVAKTRAAAGGRGRPRIFIYDFSPGLNSFEKSGEGRSGKPAT
jgi:hypothetical protein